ncbi:MAG TPA: helix-turn-helix domain-containing protein [Thermoleophilia bacterium]|nr:helix-turn-helix domain-containing protein [Thermoleophilia bacterium]
MLAAQRLFAERGYRGVTVREIGAAAGVSHALVHRYFGSKHDILVAVFRHNATPMAATAQSDPTARGTTIAMMRALRTQRRDYLKLVTRLALDGAPVESIGHDFPALRLFTELLERESDAEAVRAGELPDPRVLAAAATAIVYGWTAMEDWLVPLVGLAESDRARIEASLELVVGAMIAASLSPRVVSDGGTPAPTGCSETRGQSDVH